MELLPKQADFLWLARWAPPEIEEGLYSGSFGAGKSIAGCIALLSRATVPGAREGLARLRLKDLKDTTLRLLLEGEGNIPPLLQPGTYTHNQSKQEIRLLSGGMVVYFGLDDTAKLGSKNMTGCFVDECAELDFDRWRWLIGRTMDRVVVPGLTGRLYGACNPGAPSHFLAERFGLAGDAVCQPQCRAVRTRTTDNPHLSPKYVGAISRFTGMMYRRYVLGEWCGSDTLVYPMLEREKHMVERSKKGWIRSWVGIDDGFTKPFACLLVLENADGALHTYREVYGAGYNERVKCEHVERMMRIAQALDAPVEQVVVDPSASSIKGAMRARGLPVVNGDNEVMAGIQELRERFTTLGGDGRPMMTVDPLCTQTVRELESYEMDADAKVEKPVKENDHAPDALRYIGMQCRNPALVVFDFERLKAAWDRTPPKPPVLAHVMHREEPGPRMDASLALAELEAITIFVASAVKGRARAGTRVGSPRLKLWMKLNRNNVPARGRYALFAACAPPSSKLPSLITIGEANTRRIVAEWASAGVTPQTVARVAAMLGLWLAGTAEPGADLECPPLWWYESGPGGLGVNIGAKLAQIEYPGVFAAEGWRPAGKDFADQASMLRAAWENGTLVESDDAAIKEAKGYVWKGATVMPLEMLGEDASAAVVCDRVVTRAGLLAMLEKMGATDIEEPEPPYGTMEQRRRDREGVVEQDEEVEV